MDESIVVMDCDLYTYDAAIERYERERHHSWLCRQRKLSEVRERQKRKRARLVRQRVYGLTITLLGLLLMALGAGEGMLCIIAGIGVCISKKIII